MKKNILIGLCALCIPGMAFAGCPKSLSAEMMAECNRVENTGMNYQEWKRGVSNSGTTTDSASAVSPVTGSDIRSMQPAAGKPAAEANKK